MNAPVHSAQSYTCTWCTLADDSISLGRVVPGRPLPLVQLLVVTLHGVSVYGKRSQGLASQEVQVLGGVEVGRRRWCALLLTSVG